MTLFAMCVAGAALAVSGTCVCVLVSKQAMEAIFQVLGKLSS